MMAWNAGVANLGVWLQAYVLDRPVVDYRGISGVYNFNLNWGAEDLSLAIWVVPSPVPLMKRVVLTCTRPFNSNWDCGWNRRRRRWKFL